MHLLERVQASVQAFTVASSKVQRDRRRKRQGDGERGVEQNRGMWRACQRKIEIEKKEKSSANNNTVYN